MSTTRHFYQLLDVDDGAMYTQRHTNDPILFTLDFLTFTTVNSACTNNTVDSSMVLGALPRLTATMYSHESRQMGGGLFLIVKVTYIRSNTTLQVNSTVLEHMCYYCSIVSKSWCSLEIIQF